MESSNSDLPPPLPSLFATQDPLVVVNSLQVGEDPLRNRPTTSSDNRYHHQHHHQHDEEKGPILPQWSQFTSFIRRCISKGVVILSGYAARNPKRVVTFISLLSIAILPIGFFTNFRMEVEQEAILAPLNSLSRESYDWIEKESGFPKSTRPFDLLIHENGNDVLTLTAMKRVFEALDWFRDAPGYHDICASGGYEDFSGEITCPINSATRFWNHNVTYFEETAQSDQEMIVVLSGDEYPGGRPVGDHDFILGNYERYQKNNSKNDDGNNTSTTQLLKSAQSYLIRIDVPVTEEAYDFEDAMTVRLLQLRDRWAREPHNPVRLEFFTFRSIPNEFTRAIKMDLPLYPVVFFLMCGFTCLAFFRKDRAHSRCLLGIGPVVTIAFSLMTGNGLMFLMGKFLRRIFFPVHLRIAKIPCFENFNYLTFWHLAFLPTSH